LYKAVLPVARKRQADILLTLNESERASLYSIIDKLAATIGNVENGDAE
jgi:hypothetical protein